MLNILISNQKEYSPIRLGSGSIVLGRAPRPGGLTHTLQDDYCSASEWPSASLSGLTDAPGLERLTRWFETVVTVQRSAASSDAFFLETARAVVDLIGLDCGLILSRRAGEWKPEACYPVDALPAI